MVEHKQKLDGMSVVESWITEGKNDKSTNYGFNFSIMDLFVDILTNKVYLTPL